MILVANEGNRRWTPYAYGNNNPVRFIDPDGRESSAYGGFTSSEELAERRAAASETFFNRDNNDDGCPPNCPQTAAKADATARANSVIPQLADDSMPLPQNGSLSNADS